MAEGLTRTTHLDDEAPGWKAIEAALTKLYPALEPFHVATTIPYSIGGKDPLDGVSVYPSEASRPHWHYVTFGFSELYTKESENRDWSGYGFELTFRLASDDLSNQPPIWPINLLQNLARYVFDTERWFAEGHTMSLNGPIALDRKTSLEAVTFVVDPQLGTIETPHGRVEFLQVVGLHQEERLAIIKANSSAAFLATARERIPLLITDLERASLVLATNGKPVETERG